MPQPNPYTPGAGDRPKALVGREEQLALAEGVRRQIEAGYAANCLIFVGLRGVGKTVLLKEIRDRLIAAGWFAIYVQLRTRTTVEQSFGEIALRAQKDLSFGARLTRSLKRLVRRGGGIQVLANGASVGPDQGSSDGYVLLSSVLEELGEAAGEDGVGIALIVDELQTLGEKPLGDLIHLVQDLRDRVPLAFFGGGLPYLPARFSKAATSTERFRFEPTDFLVERDAIRAVADPALAEGVSWDEDALLEVVRMAEGYPYFLQLDAFEAWEVASRRGEFGSIALHDVDAAMPSVRRQLEFGLYGSRFEKTKPGQREYLYAMVDLLGRAAGGQVARGRVRSGDVARALGRKISQASPTRDALIRQGLIHAPDHGELEFSLPGFADYLLRRRAAEED